MASRNSSGGQAGAAVHRRARLGQEVLDDHLLHVAVAGVAGGDGLERRQPVGPVLADADQDPGGERDRQSPAASRVASRRSGVLSGEPRWAARSSRSVSIIMPWLAVTVRSAASSSGNRAPGVGVGQQPGLVEHQPAHGRQVVDGRAVTVLPSQARATG